MRDEQDPRWNRPIDHGKARDARRESDIEAGLVRRTIYAAFHPDMAIAERLLSEIADEKARPYRGRNS